MEEESYRQEIQAGTLTHHAWPGGLQLLRKRQLLCIQEGEQTDAEIIAGIRKSLPKYMFPNRFHPVARMLFTPNGKIDRVSLRRKYAEETNP